MRILGIDYGTKRVGLATSDEAGQFAIPFAVFNNTKKLVNDISELLKKEGIKEVVLGESKNYQGKDNNILKDSLKLKEALQAEGYVVHLEPEFMTSAHVEKLQGKIEKIDASAAALILQSFLDKRNVKR